MQTCKTCGSQIGDNMEFCPTCGTKVEQNVQNGSSNYQQNQAPVNDQQGQTSANYQQNQDAPSYQQNQDLPSYQQVPAATPEVGSTVPVSTPGPVKPKGGKKGLIIAIIAVVLVALLAFAGYWFFFRDGGDEVKETSASNSALNSESSGEKIVIDEKTFAGVEVSERASVELYPDRSVSADDLKKFAGIIEERVKLLGDTYQIQSDSEKITLVIEKSLLGSTSTERAAVVDMLVSRGNVGIGNDTYKSYDCDLNDFSDMKITELNRVDLISKYSANMSEDRYKQFETMSAETVYALEVTLSSDAKDDAESIAEYNSEPKFCFFHDYTKEEYDSEKIKFLASAFVKAKDDYSKFYFVSPAASYAKSADLMKLMFEQETLDFGLTVFITDEPNWDKADDVNRGKNQVDSMGDGAIIAQYSPDKFTRSYNSEVEFAEYESAVKKRLDVLGIDYMFGTTGFDDKTYCVKLMPGDISPDFFRLIMKERTFDVRSTFDDLYGFYNPEVVEKDGKLALRVEASYDASELLEEYNISNNTVYLVVNDVTIACADVTQIQPGEYYGYLDFETFLCFDDSIATENERNILDLICAISEESYVNMDGTFDFVNYDSDGEDKSLDDYTWKYSAITAEDESVINTISSMGYDVEKKIDVRNMLVITIDVPVDENLVTDFADAVKEIYSACYFDSGAYNEIHFVIKDEKSESPANDFRLEFKKDTYDGKMEVYDYVSGPKFNDYWSEMYDLTESDDFFVAKSPY
ncbi:MAG: hypothetical protein IJB70_04365 [Clostridia bacterium]|nr:hypothetical protein [Clostridia bacterium]